MRCENLPRNSMQLVELPDELLTVVLDKLRPRHLFRAMLACRRLWNLGRLCLTWDTQRASGVYPAPKRSAKVYKTSFDIVTRRCCKMCWRGARDDFGFCRSCRLCPSRLAVRYYNLRKSRVLVAGLNRRLAKLRGQLEASEAAMRQHQFELHLHSGVLNSNGITNHPTPRSDIGIAAGNCRAADVLRAIS